MHQARSAAGVGTHRAQPSPWISIRVVANGSWCSTGLTVDQSVARALMCNLCSLQGDDGDDFLVLGVRNGRLVHRFNLGSGVGAIASDRLNRQLPVHSVVFGRSGRTGWLQVIPPRPSVRPSVHLSCTHHTYPAPVCLSVYYHYICGFKVCMNVCCVLRQLTL